MKRPCGLQVQRWLRAVSKLACVALLTGGAIPGTSAQDSPATGVTDPVLMAWAGQDDVASCSVCHYAAPVGGLRPPDTSFSRQDELQFWLANDKHAIARRRVEPLTIDERDQEAINYARKLGLQSVPADWFGDSNLLSRRICDKLGYDVATTEGYGRFRDNCLTCHGGYRGAQDDVHFAKGEGGQPGISCNYCHQINGNDAWVNQHGINAAERWRLLPPELKSAQGMRDLVNMTVQAANCFDCHIGNRDQDMFVTHAMYAAGHPPLPGIELQTFCESMPQHWRTEGELYSSLADFEKRDLYFQVNFPPLFAGEKLLQRRPGDVLWNTRKVLVGALVARTHWLDLMIASATPDRWADYSLYDCASCHHDLREPSPRQTRGYVGAPGRPRQSEWTVPLLEVALLTVSTQTRDEVRELEHQLAVEFSDTPFGDSERVAAIARRLRSAIQRAMEELEALPIKSGVGPGAIWRLAQTKPEQLLVYDAARQVVWAIQAIAKELEFVGEALPDEIMSQINELSEPIEKDGDMGVAAVSAVTRITTGIDTTLPSGRQAFIYPDNLYSDLRRKATFDPAALAVRLESLAASLVAMRQRPLESD